MQAPRHWLRNAAQKSENCKGNFFPECTEYKELSNCATNYKVLIMSMWWSAIFTKRAALNISSELWHMPLSVTWGTSKHSLPVHI